MTISDFLWKHIGEQAYEPEHHYFWVRTVVDAMQLLGPETDADLERLTRLLLDYYFGADIDASVIDNMRREMMGLGIQYGMEHAPLDLKYRCIWNMASSREQNDYIKRNNIADDFECGLDTAFDHINWDGDKDDAVIALIRENAVKYGMDLHESDPNDHS